MANSQYYNNEFGVQRIFLTATLPLALEPDLFSLLQIDGRNIKIYRSSTRQSNISYNVEIVHTFEGCVQRIRNEISCLPIVDQKVIIYCRKIDELERLSSEIRCHKYYHHLDGKDDYFGQWESLPGIQVIAATSSLGAGIDIPNVTLVLMFGLPTSLLDLVQATGRAGRNLQPAKALVLDYDRKGMKNCKFDPAIFDFVERNTCRRLVIDANMDSYYYNSDNVCNYMKNGELLCDHCTGSRNVNELSIESMDGEFPNTVNDFEIEATDTPFIPSKNPNTVDNSELEATGTPVIPSNNPNTLEATPVIRSNPTQNPYRRSNSTFVTPAARTPRTSSMITTFETPITLNQPDKRNTDTLFNSKSDLAEKNDCESFIEHFYEICFLCELENRTTSSTCFFACRRHSNDKDKDKQYKKILGNVSFSKKEILSNSMLPDFHGCKFSGCYVPQPWCPRWMMYTTSTDKVLYRLNPNIQKCYYKNVLLGVIFACVELVPNCRTIYNKHFGSDREYQMQAIEWGGIETIRLVRTFFHIYQEYRVHVPRNENVSAGRKRCRLN